VALRQGDLCLGWIVRHTLHKQDAASEVVQAPPGVINNSGTPSGCRWRRLPFDNARPDGAMSAQF